MTCGVIKPLCRLLNTKDNEHIIEQSKMAIRGASEWPAAKTACVGEMLKLEGASKLLFWVYGDGACAPLVAVLDDKDISIERIETIVDVLRECSIKSIAANLYVGKKLRAIEQNVNEVSQRHRDICTDILAALE